MNELENRRALISELRAMKGKELTPPPSKAKIPPVGYIAREFVLLNLPYKKPESNVWIRQNGNIALVVQGGFSFDKKTGKALEIGLPYGSTARLVLYYILSAAAFSESRKIYLGSSFDSFLKAIGASTERRGKKTGSAAVLNQLSRLRFSSFNIVRLDENEDFTVEQVQTLPLFSNSEIWFSKKKGEINQQGLWNSYVELSESLFNSIKKNPIPIDWDIVMKIRKNPTALDLYALLTYESAKAQAKGKGRFIPWASLRGQLGSDIGRADKFGTKARAAIKAIQKHYPGLKVSFPAGGLQIEAGSLPSVKPLEAIPALFVPKEAAPANLDSIKLSPTAYERAKEAAPGYDVYYLETEWRCFVSKCTTLPDKPEAAFIGFCRNKAKRKPLR